MFFFEIRKIITTKKMRIIMRFIRLLIALITCNCFCYGNNIIEVQGHRGCRGLLPENTLPAFAAAIDAGVDSIEMDLLVTKDGEIVVHHDYFLNNTLCTFLNRAPIVGKTLIRDLTLEEVKRIDCGSKKNPNFPCQKTLPGTQIPTLEEVFTFVKGKNVRLILEVKRDADHPEYTLAPELLAKKITEAVRKSGLEPRIYYSSFDKEVLAEIRKIDPMAKIEFINAQTLDGMIEVATSLKAEIVSPEQSLLKTTEDVKALQAAGFRVITWTVNDPESWRKLIEMGVDGIVTDYPQDLIFFLQNLCSPNRKVAFLSKCYG